MQSLTEEEVAPWLAACGMRMAPYGKPDPALDRLYRQVRIPPAAGPRWAFASAVVKGSGGFQEALLHFTDWAHYTPDQMAIVAAVLAGYGESRPLIEVPAQTFGSGEGDLLTGLLGLAMTFDWTVYLYVEGGPTFLVWEGVFLDMWVPKGKQRKLYEWIDPFCGSGE